MRAPRRVPWASRRELEELYELLFSPSSDFITRHRGLNRINVYLASPSCPAFLPLLHGLMTAASLPAPSSPEEMLLTRMSCAMAIVRFVNGMVDPLQTGGYARPIVHLAASIGIPPILISIRHRATHDDLPPLPLLLNSVNMAIDYLHHYAFLPLLASSSDAAVSGAVLAGRVKAENLVKRWKRAMKIRIRDKLVGDENETGRELRKVKRELETVDPEDVISLLVGVEGLIPLARRKRPATSATVPTQGLLLLWGGFLTHLTSLHPLTPTLMAEQILSILLDTSTSITANTAFESDDPALRRREEDSARWCLATWLLWLWASEGSMALRDEDKEGARRRILVSLLSGDTTLRALHKVLLAGDSTSDSRLDLKDVLFSDDSDEELEGLDAGLPLDDMADKLGEMERRLQHLEESMNVPSPEQPNRTESYTETGANHDLPSGWRRLTEWKETPIGMPISC